MTDHLTIPDDLLPSDGRFGSGPSKVPVPTLEALADSSTSIMGTSHRRPAVKNLVGTVRSRLKDLFNLPDGYEVLLSNGGATLFWDAAAFSLINAKSEHLVFGEFSSKFASAAKKAPHLSGVVEVNADYGSCPDLVEDPSVDLYALTHNETSTGVMAPLSRPAGDALVAVDATSAAGTVMVDPSVFDVYYFSPQKAFASDGGIWFGLFSPAAIARVEEIKASGRYMPSSLDLSIAVQNSRENQTYNTPALATLFLMNETLAWMELHGGLEFTSKRCAASAATIYGWAERSAFATPYVTDPKLRSQAVATIDFAEQVDAEQVAKTLRANGIVDTEPYRKLGRNQLRIALFPAIDPTDIEALTACIDYVVERL